MPVIYTNQGSLGPKGNNLFVNLLVLSEAGFMAFQDYVKSKNSFIDQPLSLKTLKILSVFSSKNFSVALVSLYREVNGLFGTSGFSTLSRFKRFAASKYLAFFICQSCSPLKSPIKC